MIIKKIPLEELLDVLDYLYEIGVDYVDFTGDEQNNIMVSFLKEYVAEEFKKNFPEDTTTEIDLNNDSLNDLT
jgi:hypothetical protein